ncbi:MAG: SufE family protein [Verrucomicrobiales bacterium]
MKLSEKQQELIDDYLIIEDLAERRTAIIAGGPKALPYPEEARTEDCRVHGCSSGVWVTGWLDEKGLCEFRTDSDSPAVKALAEMLCRPIPDFLPRKWSEDPRFIHELGIDRFLTPTRLRGLGNVHGRVRQLALSWGA